MNLRYYTHLHDITSDVLLLLLLVLLNNWLTSNIAGGVDALVLLSAITLSSDWLELATYLYGLALDESESMATGNCVTTLFFANRGWVAGRLAGRTGRNGLLLIVVFCLKLAGLFNWNITYI